MTLPHVLRNGGPKQRLPVSLINPTAADFAKLGSYVKGDTFTFTRTVASDLTEQSYTFPLKGGRDLAVTLDGASGGIHGPGRGTYGSGPSGARASAIINVNALVAANPGQNSLLVYLGGRGENTDGGIDGGGAGARGGTNGGANGAGTGGSGGGGRTDIRRTTDPLTEVIVAGGGGSGAGNPGNSGGPYYNRVNGRAGVSGQTAETTNPDGTTSGGYAYDNSGGGGGYLGGNTSTGDDNRTGYGGSSWADATLTSNAVLPAGGAASTKALAVIVVQ